MRAARLSENVRPPAVAGMFYPRDPGELRAQVLRFLAAETAPAVAAPKAPIARMPATSIRDRRRRRPSRCCARRTRSSASW